jgi:hypothetical protein
MGIESKRPGIAALLYGAVLFLAGFVAVLGFWNLGDHPDHLTGLFSYRSATWGDGLFLPLQAIAVKYLVDGLSRPRHRWLVEAATATGFLLGVFVIWSWWHDPSPQLNWTMPEPHTFTAAGYWHALFLIGACGVFARLWTDLLLRLHHHRSTPDVALRTLNSGCFATALGSAVCYVALAGFDSSRSASTQAGSATLIALSLGLVSFLATISLVTGRVLIITPRPSPEAHQPAQETPHATIPQTPTHKPKHTNPNHPDTPSMSPQHEQQIPEQLPVAGPRPDRPGRPRQGASAQLVVGCPWAGRPWGKATRATGYGGASISLWRFGGGSGPPGYGRQRSPRR